MPYMVLKIFTMVKKHKNILQKITIVLALLLLVACASKSKNVQNRRRFQSKLEL